MLIKGANGLRELWAGEAKGGYYTWVRVAGWFERGVSGMLACRVDAGGFMDSGLTRWLGIN